jgi:hypothetical protein
VLGRSIDVEGDLILRMEGIGHITTPQRGLALPLSLHTWPSQDLG